MRKQTKEVTSAFLCGTAFKGSNSYTDGKSLYLFGNKIAEHRDGGVWICSCGYVTRTTSDRLNALPNVNISMKQGYFYLNGQMWSGEWTRVCDSNIVIDESKVGSCWDMTAEWINVYGRGYYQPLYAVCGANDTGMFEDSPCPSDVGDKELMQIIDLLKKAKIDVKKAVLETSNVFCVHKYLVVKPMHINEARELVQNYILSNETRLMYAC
jgi:hypothetical protein